MSTYPSSATVPAVGSLQRGDPLQLGPYVLLGRLGSGGMGTVFRAQAPDGRVVVVKTLLEELAGDERARARFRREVSILRSLPESVTPRVVDADLDAEPPYVVTESSESPTLASVLETEQFDGAQTLLLARSLASALAEAHARDVVHRDVKPDNILVDDRGARLIDFGVASDLAATALTRTGTVLGTIGYAAPEVLRGEPADAAADVFGWACVVCHVAAGVPPFGSGRADSVAYRVSQGQPDVPPMPAPLGALVTASLSKDAGSRPSAGDVRDALDRVPVVDVTLPSAAARAESDGLRSLGPFTLVQRLHRGTVSDVYRGWDDAGRQAVVKLLREDLSGDTFALEHLRTEARVLQDVPGRLTPSLLAADVASDTPWVATAYVDGDTLAEAVRARGRFTPGDQRRLADDLATALVEVHDGGLVHRDLHPGNVLLRRDGGTAVLLDLGLAAEPGTPQPVDSSGRVRGARPWLSPEQSAGQAVGPEADVYAWGLLVKYAAYGTAAGLRPGAPAVTVVDAKTLVPHAALLADHAMDGVLEALVERALHDDPAARPTLEEILTSLERGDTSGAAGTPGSRGRTRGRRAATAAVGALFVLAIGAVPLIMSQGIHADQPGPASGSSSTSPSSGGPAGTRTEADPETYADLQARLPGHELSRAASVADVTTVLAVDPDGTATVWELREGVWTQAASLTVDTADSIDVADVTGDAVPDFVLITDDESAGTSSVQVVSSAPGEWAVIPFEPSFYGPYEGGDSAPLVRYDSTGIYVDTCGCEAYTTEWQQGVVPYTYYDGVFIGPGT